MILKLKRQVNFFPVLVFGFLGFCFFCLPSSFFPLPSFDVAYAQSIFSTELISHAKDYDETVVSYEGELIGSVLGRGEFVWLNLYDGANALGVWVQRPLLGGVSRGGNYKTRGDWIRVSGIFRRACPEHGGGLDIHATTLEIVRAGSMVGEVFSVRKIFFLVILIGVFVCLWIVHILRVRRAKE